MSKKEVKIIKNLFLAKCSSQTEVVWKRRNKNILIDFNFTVKPVGFFILDSESIIDELISTEVEFQNFSDFNH